MTKKQEDISLSLSDVELIEKLAAVVPPPHGLRKDRAAPSLLLKPFSKHL